MKWMCSICGYTYDGEDFTKEADDYLCPLCDSGKENFQQRDLATEIAAATNQFFAVQEEEQKPSETMKRMSDLVNRRMTSFF